MQVTAKIRLLTTYTRLCNRLTLIRISKSGNQFQKSYRLRIFLTHNLIFFLNSCNLNTTKCRFLHLLFCILHFFFSASEKTDICWKPLKLSTALGFLVLILGLIPGSRLFPGLCHSTVHSVTIHYTYTVQYKDTVQYTLTLYSTLHHCTVHSVTIQCTLSLYSLSVQYST